MATVQSIGRDTTVAEALERISHASCVFELLEVDTCCESGTTLTRAAEGCGLEPDELLTLLSDDDATPLPVPVTPPGLAEAPLRVQIDHITRAHHRYARRQLLRLDRQMSRLWGGHRRTVGWLPEMRSLLRELTDELIPHMAREELYLFPYCLSLEEEMKPDVRILVPLFGSLDYPLASITEDHGDDSRRLVEMRRLTSGFQPQGDACRTLRRFLEGVAQLERALQEHIRIENRMLFPKAKALEKAARQQKPQA